MAWFVVIFGINTTSDISKLLYVNLRQFWNITSSIYAKYHVQIILWFVYTTTQKRFVIFTRRYFKLSWNTTVLSQSNCRNFSCSSITRVNHLITFCYNGWQITLTIASFWHVYQIDCTKNFRAIKVWLKSIHWLLFKPTTATSLRISQAWFKSGFPGS